MLWYAQISYVSDTVKTINNAGNLQYLTNNVKYSQKSHFLTKRPKKAHFFLCFRTKNDVLSNQDFILYDF